MQTDKFGDIIIICGHYGCGKTNLALNMAADCARRGEEVTLIDLDIVNPYFRSSDYGEFIKENNIELIAPTYAHSNLDLPSIPVEMYSIFTRNGRRIIDVGGDDSGATALGRFAPQLKNTNYTMLYVINKYRIQSTTPEEACKLLREIETASRLTADYIVNNSHLMEYTDAETVRASFGFADEISEILGLPVAFTAVNSSFADRLEGETEVYPIDVIVKKPWEN